MRARFDSQLEKLNNMMIEMGGMIETAIKLSMDALKGQDAERIKQSIEYDATIDQQEKDIEALCLKLILQFQPVAGDLHLISAALKMVTDMERIGDQASDIAEVRGMFQGDLPIGKVEHFSQMADAAIKMVTDSIDAYVKRDMKLAEAVIAEDDVVDDLFDQVKADIIELIHQNPANGEQAIDLLMIAKYFERIGDHAVNIAEWVEFAMTGKHKE